MVRPASDFASDSDEKYLERRFPDLFPFSRGGFDEVRKVRISRNAYAAYLSNLSNRQFQKVDFVLPVYDMSVRGDSFNMARVRASLPSRLVNAYGTAVPMAEAYAKILTEDLRKAAAYNTERTNNAKLGKRLPPAPTISISGLAQSFFIDMSLSARPNPHSQEACFRNRQDAYAENTSLGKAHAWFTISPDDAKAFQVIWYALGPEQSEPYKNQVPDGSLRFSTLADNPMAAALYFEKVLYITFDKIIGWNRKKKKANSTVGLFGKPVAWVAAVEGQFRLTLHAHILIWLLGHERIENQFNKAHVSDCMFRQRNSQSLVKYLVFYLILKL